MGSKSVILAHKSYWIIEFSNPHTCVKPTQACQPKKQLHTLTNIHKCTENSKMVAGEKMFTHCDFSFFHCYPTSLGYLSVLRFCSAQRAERRLP